jgi:hypothetical protein
MIRSHGCRVLALALLLGLTAWAAPSAAQDSASESAESPFGIGFQSSWPAYGLSALWDVSDTFTAQGVIGAFGGLTTLSARGLYHFQREEKYSLYGFGTFGIWRNSYNDLDRSESETSPGFGGGAGVDLDWRSIIGDDEFPPLYSSIDLGFVAATFDHYDFSGLVFGVGLHYRF